MTNFLNYRASVGVSPESFGATGVGNDAAALNAWLTSTLPKVADPSKTYSFSSALTFPNTTIIEGTLNLIWTGASSVSVGTIGNDCEIDTLSITVPTATSNTMTIGTGYKGRIIRAESLVATGSGFLTIANPAGLDLDLFESLGGFQRPLVLGNASAWSARGRLGMARIRDYTRGIGVNYLDGFALEGYDIAGRHALASYSPGHNGILATGIRNCRFGPGIIKDAGEHLFRLGGAADMGASHNNTFGDMTLDGPGGSFIKLNPDVLFYDFRFSDVTAVGRFTSGAGGNRELFRFSHGYNVSFGNVRIVAADGALYSCQDAFALNNFVGLTVQSLHAERLNQSVLDCVSGQDIASGLGDGPVRNVTIGKVTGVDLTNRTLVLLAMAAGQPVSGIHISGVDYFTDGQLVSASATTVVDGPCSISGRLHKTNLSTLPTTTRLPANMAVNLMIGEATAVSRDGALVFTGPDVDFAVQAPLAAMLVDDNDRTLLGVTARGEVVSATPTGVAPMRYADAANQWQNTGWPEYYYADPLRLPQDIERRAIIIPGYGQSLAGAANDNPTDTLTNAVATYPDHAFMPAIGPAPDGFWFDSVRPLVDIAGSGFNTRRAHWLSSMANGIIAAMDTAFGVRPKIIAFSASQGGRAYNDLMPGNEAFRYLAKGIQGACVAARNMGLIPWVPAIFWVQGEQNRAEGVSEERIRRDLQAMGHQVTALVRSMTGQTDDPVIFISQPNNSLPDNGIIPPHMTVPVSMDGIANMRVLPPHYNLGMSSDGVSNTGVHPDSAGYQVMGARFATIFNEEIFGRGYTAIKCVQAFWESSTVIRLKYQTRGGNLVIDTSGSVVTVPAWAGSLNGWQFFDGTGSPPTIASMTVVDDPDTTGTALTVLRIVLSAAPTGTFPRLHYATRNDGTGANSGRLTGPRGCLRDSLQPTFWANSQVIYLGKP